MNLSELPKDLPVPVDDGAADHLSGIMLPHISLDLAQMVSEALSYDPPNLHARFSSGQNGNNFLSLWHQAGINLSLGRRVKSGTGKDR